MPKAATKPKHSRALEPLKKRLEANRPGLGMAIDDLLMVTTCQGLKKVSAAARESTLEQLRADGRFDVSESLGSPGGWDVSLRRSDALPPAEIVPGEDDEPPTDEDPEPTEENRKLDKLVEGFAGNHEAALPMAEALKVMNLKVTKSSPGFLCDAIWKDGRMEVFDLAGHQHIRLKVKTLGERLAEKEANGEPAKPTKISEPISTAPVPEAAAPLTDEEKHNLLFKAMGDHQQQGAKLAAEFFDLKRQEATQDGALKITRETIKELQKTMASHMAAVPTLETIAQRKIEFDTGSDATGDAPVPDSWPYKVPADQIIPLDQIPGLSFDIMANRIRGELPYQSEPHQIGGDVIEIKGSRYLLRESSPDDRRWFAQPVLTKDEWQQLHEATYGRPVKDFDQHDEAKATRQAGGEDCGRLVKVSRSQAVLGPESHGIVITVPDALYPVPLQATKTGKDAAAGDDPEDDGNRIVQD